LPPLLWIYCSGPATIFNYFHHKRFHYHFAAKVALTTGGASKPWLSSDKELQLQKELTKTCY
jgi:hypothetical protein